MDYNTIVEAFEAGELSLSKDELVDVIVRASTREEHIDCDFLKDVIADIRAVKKSSMEDFKEVKKQLTAAANADLADVAKEYFATLKQGDAIQWVANGVVVSGTVGEQKEGAKTAHLLLDKIPANSKAKEPKADRYVKFEKIVVPEGFQVAADAA